LLSDGVGTLVCENNKFVYSLFNADQIFDYLLSIGMKPFVELSFMPTTLSSGGDTVFHYKGNVTPPKDFNSWGSFIEKIVTHWVERYGLTEVREWFFEVWNEPNLKAFWSGTQQDYFKLYFQTAQAIKKVSPELKVGGPATAANAWIPEFLDYCERENAAVDFISTHHYPTDAFGKPGDDTVSQLAASHRGVLREQVIHSQLQARGKPVYYTEWSTSSNPFDDLHDLPYAAAFVAKTVLEARGAVQGYSYWTFSDIFEENYFSSKPFHGGFGLMNIYGIPKPAYRAYELLHRLGDEIFNVEGQHSTVDTWVTRRGRILKILITNGALPKHPIKTEMVQIHFKGLSKVKDAYVERIDDDHSNPRKIWEQMRQPSSLSNMQVHELETASSLIKQPVNIIAKEKDFVVPLSMPEQGTACLTIELE
jgi:xylan 1,4-beta-xylosidase